MKMNHKVFRIILNIHLFITILFVLIIPYGIFNTYISIKYEVEEGGKYINAAFLEDSYYSIIQLLRIGGFYLLINVVILFILKLYYKKWIEGKQ